MSIRKLLLIFLFLVLLSFGAVWGILKEKATPEPIGTPYQLDPDWPTSLDGILFGVVSGVDVDRAGNVFVLHRADRVWQGEVLALDFIPGATVLVFSGETGEVIRQWGMNTFVMPHSLTIDLQGDVWITDVGLHQVLKFDSKGNLLMSLGEKGISGSDSTHFNMPTDVAVASDGSFYVSDGYGNNRIVHFSAEGQVIRQWGTQGTAPGQFNLPHSVALDAAGRVYVADRGNGRLQIFSRTGEFLDSWESQELGRPWAVRVGEDGFIYVVDGGDQQDFWPDRARILKLDVKGQIVLAFGSHGSQPGQFIWPHALGLGQEGVLFVGDVRREMGIQKFVPVP